MIDHVERHRQFFPLEVEVGLLDEPPMPPATLKADDLCPDCGAMIRSRDCEHGINTGRRTLVAIDPGDVHQGVAVFQQRGAKKLWRCTVAFESRPWDLLTLLSVAGASGLVEAFVVERFVLEAARAPMLSGSDLETAQMIGAIKLVAASHGIPFIGQTNKIKKPVRSILNARDIKSRAKKLKQGGHAADAELHGYYYLLKTLDVRVWHG